MRYMNSIRYKLVFILFFLGLSGWLVAQNTHDIEGNVYSAANGSPLKGIQVKSAQETGETATTDENGYFRITVSSANAKLSFSYPGYITVEKFATNEKMVVYLYESGAVTPEEEINVAYATLKKKNMNLAAEKVYCPSEALAGVDVFDQLLKTTTSQTINRSGTVGEGAKVNIRGYSSIFAKTDPLIIMDGLVLENHATNDGVINGLFYDPLFNIDPRDIESITVLKDAAATAIYGAKASDGVIILKTKSVGVGNTSIGISAYGGVNMMQHEDLPVLTDMTEAKTYLLGQMYSSGLTTEQINSKYPYFKGDPNDPEYYNYNNVTNWQDEVFELGSNTGAHFNMKGGDEIAKYYFSTGFMRNEGIVTNSATSRYSLKLNALVKVAKWAEANAVMGFTYLDGNYLEQGNVKSTNPMFAALIKQPFMSSHIRSEEGLDLPITSDADQMGFSNPYDVVNNTDASRGGYDYTGLINFKFNITKHLWGNARIGTAINKIRDQVFLPDWGFGNNGNYYAKQVVKQSTNKMNNVNGEVNMMYDNSFNIVHHLNAVAGMRAGSTSVNYNFGIGLNTASDDFKDLQGTTGRREHGGYNYLWNDYAFYGSANYDYKEKYFVGVSLSADASSTFGADANKYLLSNAVSLSWNIANENFLVNSKNVNLLKLRFSYGNTANSRIGVFTAKHYYRSVQYYTTAGLIRGNLPNETLQGERNAKLNFGVDASLFRNRLMASFDIYSNKTKDLLSYMTPAPEYGYEKYWQNNGELKTSGYEISLEGVIFNGDFKWSIGGTIGSYAMELNGLDEGSFVMQMGDAEKIFANGQAPGLFYGYKSEGVIRTKAEADALSLTHEGNRFEAGDIHFADKDNNKIINSDDKVVIGDPTPDFYGSITNTFKYKFLSLEAVASFVQGNDVYNWQRRQLEGMSGFENQSVVVKRRWQVEGQDTDIPRAVYGDPMENSRFSDRWIEDGSYFRLSRVTLNVNIAHWMKKMDYFDVYVSGMNLLTVTKYLGYDPEFSYGNGMMWDGIDYGKFPQYASVLLGLKIKL